MDQQKQAGGMGGDASLDHQAARFATGGGRFAGPQVEHRVDGIGRTCRVVSFPVLLLAQTQCLF
ncbi:MAG: hypothetical protein GXY55_06020 [Phycisphaerae bacterium]|nr:hypothetical protein [Phycisphaerae bacterium]